MSTYRIAIIEDDLDLQEVLIDYLQRAGFQTEGYESSEKFFERADLERFDGFLVDRKLPGKSGLEVVRVLKNKRLSVPIVMVTGQSEPSEIIEGIESGADDYITKPFHYQVLVTKLTQLIERFRSLSSLKEPLKLMGGNSLRILENSLELTDGMDAVRFTKTEFNIFCPLFRRIGSFVRREDLFENESPQKSRSLDVHIASIRKKIRPFGLDIETLRGVGYRLEEPTSDHPVTTV
jgi:DNA-binding response OmpR family regulator